MQTVKLAQLAKTIRSKNAGVDRNHLRHHFS